MVHTNSVAVITIRRFVPTKASQPCFAWHGLQVVQNSINEQPSRHRYFSINDCTQMFPKGFRHGIFLTKVRIPPSHWSFPALISMTKMDAGTERVQETPIVPQTMTYEFQYIISSLSMGLI